MASLVSALFTSNFWISGYAIARYMPRAFRLPQVDGMALFTEKKREEYLSRVAALKQETTHCWGTMTVDQGIHHLNLACGSGLGFYQLPDESYLLARTIFRWILVDWYPEQPVGLRLPADFKIPHDQHFDFHDEKSKLMVIIDTACKAKDKAAWGPHPMFGKMSLWEWGKLLQIHIDYHLRQFGV